MSLKKRGSRGGPVLFILITVVLVAASGFFLFNWEKYMRKGLDLEGGVYVLLEAKSLDGSEDGDAIQRAMAIISNRIDELGLAEPIIQSEGERRIRIELPGIEDQAQAMEIIGRTAQLTFKSPEGEVLLTGANLKTANFTRGQYSEPIVTLEFDEEGAEKFAAATEKYLHQPISIYLDEELISAPTVQNVIEDGNAMITGIPTAEEAANIALLLRSGALPVELEELETRSVGPVLGENALRLSFSAGVAGLIMVILYMLFFYRFAGLISVISLVVYVALVFAILFWFKATMTLPGIAGLILSIGMAVDANIIIFERIKEELHKGRTTLTAINAGFERALRAILDANITTIIAGAVLFIVASGSVRGFAIVLLVGIVVSLFTAFFLTRFMLRLAARSGMIKTPQYLGLKEAQTSDQV
mgnify:CR=1 FL=1